MTENNVEVSAISARSELAQDVGQQLTQAREQIKLSVAEVAQRLRMSVKQIEALEAQRWHEFPSPAILRGFIRAYAKLLNVKVEPMLSVCSPGQSERVGLSYTPPVSVALPRRRLSPKTVKRAVFLSFFVASLAVSAVVLWTNWKNISQWSQARLASSSTSARTVEVPVALATAPAPAPLPALAPAAPVALPVAPNPSLDLNTNSPPGSLAAAENFSLSLTFSGESWVEILEADNTVLARGLQPAGTELNLQGKAPPYRLLIGNAKQVVLKYQGKNIDLSPYIGEKVARLKLE